MSDSVLSLANCVTVGKWICHSELQFSYLHGLLKETKLHSR